MIAFLMGDEDSIEENLINGGSGESDSQAYRRLK
jgi:hypothetical protein